MESRAPGLDERKDRSQDHENDYGNPGGKQDAAFLRSSSLLEDDAEPRTDNGSDEPGPKGVAHGKRLNGPSVE